MKLRNILFVIGCLVVAAAAGAVSALCVLKHAQPALMGFNPAVVNVPALVSSSPKIQALQEEQRAVVDDLTKFVQEANAKLSAEKNDKVKAELEKELAAELAKKQAGFEEEYRVKLEEISNSLTNAIAEKAKEKGFNVVLSKDAVVSGMKDITEDLLGNIE